jgi:inner membrane protein
MIQSMPSSISHATVGLAIGAMCRPRQALVTPRYWIAGAVMAALPDIDAIGRPFHLGDVSWLGGHRGLTHSLLFAGAFAALAVTLWFRRPPWDSHRVRVWLYLAGAMGSHGLLDALASYGQGVAFFAPFSWKRFTFSWHPIGPLVGPRPASTTTRVLLALGGELWIVVPALLAIVVIALLQRAARPPAASPHAHNTA